MEKKDGKYSDKDLGNASPQQMQNKDKQQSKLRAQKKRTNGRHPNKKYGY